MKKQNYIPKKLQLWTHPENYSGDTFEDYYRTGIEQSRDSKSLECANFSAMLEKLGGESKTVIINRSGHWAVGWVEAIYIHKSNSKKLKIADDLMIDFESYPVIDESLLSQIESDDLNDTIELYKDDFRKTVCEFLGTDFKNLSKIERSEVDQLIQETMYEDRGYQGVDDACVCERSIERMILSSWYNSIDSDHLNLIDFFKAAFDTEVKNE